MDGTIYAAKIILLGDFRVGKTSIRRNYMGNVFSEEYIMTIGAGYASKTLELDENTTLKLQIWDLAGQSGFEKLLQRYIAGSSALFLIFDITNKTSFENLDNWLDQFYIEPKHKKLPIILIGNKIDLEEFAVTENDIIENIKRIRQKYDIADSYMNYILTSAKTGQNIESAFRMVAKQIVN